MTLRIILYTLFEVFLESDDDGDRTQFTAISSVNTILNFAWQQQWYHSWSILVVPSQLITVLFVRYFYWRLWCVIQFNTYLATGTAKLEIYVKSVLHYIALYSPKWLCSIFIWMVVILPKSLFSSFLPVHFLISSSFSAVINVGYVLSCPIMVIHVYVSICLGHHKYCLIVRYK